MTKIIQTMTAIILSIWLPLQTRAQTPAPQASPTPPLTAFQTAQAGDVLTLEAATEQFMRRNLTVEAARLEVGVAATERVGARLFPRPGLTVSAENLTLNRATPFNRLYEVGATVAQPIELGNRRGLRAELAERTVAVAEAQLSAVLRARLFELRRVYYETILARAQVEIARDNRTGYDELVRFNTARFEEGYIAEGELIRVRLERIRFDSAIANATLAQRQAAVRLFELLGEGSFERAGTLDVAGTLQMRPVQLNLENLRQVALANRPEIKIAEAQVALGQAGADLQRSIARGEITPFVGYRRVGVDNTVLAGVTVPLPFGNRNQGGIARAEAERGVAETNLRLARNRALAEVESAYRAYETAREQVLAYEMGLLRQADESRDITLAAYREGATELVSLLEAQRTRAEVRGAYARALFDYYVSIFQLELATGVDIRP